MRIFVNGIQRSGTNYLTSILKLNTDYEIFEYDNNHWKHDICKYRLNHRSNHDKIITVIKNPYTWVESICFRNAVDVVDLHPEYNLNSDQGIIINGINLENLINLYKSFYDSWYEYGSKVIRYEYILNEKNIFKFLYNQFNIYSEDISVPEKVPHSDYFASQDIDYYLGHKSIYLEDVHTQKINELLGENFFIRYGYNMK